jgi:hypothetical protein
MTGPAVIIPARGILVGERGASADINCGGRHPERVFFNHG